MLRSLILGFALVTLTAGAQTVPPSPNTQPMQPGPPPAQAQPTDPNAVPGSPPAFVPGLNNSDNQENPRPRAIRVSGGVMAGLLLTKTDPVYPEGAKGIGGAVVMSAHIGKDGHILNLAAITGPQVLQAAALTAVKQWTYRPFMLNGEPIDVMTTITVNFTPR